MLARPVVFQIEFCNRYGEIEYFIVDADEQEQTSDLIRKARLEFEVFRKSLGLAPDCVISEDFTRG